MHPLLNIAVRALRKGGKCLVQAFEKKSFSDEKQRQPGDRLNGLKHHVQRLLVETVRNCYPDHRFCTLEEPLSIRSPAQQGTVWVVNPLDGGLNFEHGHPDFALALATRVQGVTEVSAIYHPLQDELFTAERGRGAQCNEYRLRVSYRPGSRCLVAVDSPSACLDGALVRGTRALARVLPVAGYRCSGSSLIDLASVALGRVDLAFHRVSDHTAWIPGALLVQEAGGVLLDGRELSSASGMQRAYVAGDSKRVHLALSALKSVERAPLEGEGVGAP